jgi:hypothetical protein
MWIFNFIIPKKQKQLSTGQLVLYKTTLSNKTQGVIKDIKNGKARVVTLNGGISYCSQWIPVRNLVTIL